MKRVFVLFLFVALICTSLALSSCDQETVDSVRSDLMDEIGDLLSPILKESRPEEGANNDTTPSNDGGESIPSYDTDSSDSGASNGGSADSGADSYPTDFSFDF